MDLFRHGVYAEPVHDVGYRHHHAHPSCHGKPWVFTHGHFDSPSHGSHGNGHGHSNAKHGKRSDARQHDGSLPAISCWTLSYGYETVLISFPFTVLYLRCYVLFFTCFCGYLVAHVMDECIRALVITGLIGHIARLFLCLQAFLSLRATPPRSWASLLLLQEYTAPPPCSTSAPAGQQKLTHKQGLGSGFIAFLVFTNKKCAFVKLAHDIEH